MEGLTIANIMKPMNSGKNHIPVLQFLIKFLQVHGCCQENRNIISVFTYLSLSFMIFLFLWDISQNWESLASLKRVRYLPACFMTVVKCSVLTFKSKQCWKLLNSLRHFWNAENFESKIQQQYDKIFKMTTILCPLHISIAWAFSSGLSALAWVDTDSREFVLGDFTFCDKYASYSCWFSMWLCQTLMLLFHHIPINCGFDCIFLIFVAYVYNGCELLNAAFNRLNTKNYYARKIVLREVVEQHHVIMMFVKDMNEFYTGFMLIQFCCSLWSLILYLYMIVVEGLPPHVQDATIFGSLYALFTTQLLIYSVGGTIIQVQLESIPNSIFRVDWHEKGQTKLRQDLSLMIIRGQNAGSLTVGKLTELDLLLFISVIKNSLSVFALIMQLAKSEIA